MADRRSLSEGLVATPQLAPAVAKELLDAKKLEAAASGRPIPRSDAAGSAIQPLSRVPLSTRIRSEFAEALKRASLQRQLEKIEPNTLQDILEEAIEPWLKSNGYLS
jgi:hypothetical protein